VIDPDAAGIDVGATEHEKFRHMAKSPPDIAIVDSTKCVRSLDCVLVLSQAQYRL